MRRANTRGSHWLLKEFIPSSKRKTCLVFTIHKVREAQTESESSNYTDLSRQGIVCYHERDLAATPESKRHQSGNLCLQAECPAPPGSSYNQPLKRKVSLQK